MSDTFLPLACLIGVTSVLLLRGLLIQTGMLKYPFLASAVVAGWFIPQAIGLSKVAGLPPGGFALTMMMASLSLLATVLGERLIKPHPQFQIRTYDRPILLIASAILSAIGLIAYSRILTTPAELNEEGLTTGVVTILFFFSQLQYYGLAIALLLVLKRFSWAAFAIVLIDLNSILAFVLFGGRRGPAMDVLSICLCALWFQRRFILPRLLPIAGVVVAAVLGNSIGQYRSLVQSINQYSASSEGRLPTLNEVLATDFLDDFSTTLEQGSFEGRNAIMYISGTKQTSNYDFGLGYWNYLVFRYVPGQLFGFDFKRSLMWDLPDNSAEAFGYNRHIGTTVTGFSDAFVSFGLLGALVFAGISALLQFWWLRADAGDFGYQVFYCLSLASAMQAVTHGTQWFWIYLPQLAVFLLPVLYLARDRKQPMPLLSGSSFARYAYPRHIISGSRK